jgi:hypothetical protein
MNDLLTLAVKAHGGLDRWNQFTSVKASVSVGGALWHVKGQPDALKHIRVDAHLREEQMTTHFVDQNKRMVFTPDRVAVENEDGEVLASRENPRSAFRDEVFEAPWDDLQVAYFNSYALWTYLTIPFLYCYEGFAVEELPSWQENGETWRPLRVTFPQNIASHTREQTSYFGPDGLLRRHEYTVDILGGANGVNYAYDYREFDGIAIPITRRVFAYDENKHKVPAPVLVAIDISHVNFA